MPEQIEGNKSSDEYPFLIKICFFISAVRSLRARIYDSNREVFH